MGQAPSIPTDKSRELRVIGAGFSRTGTVSFAMALERLLGGPVMHSGTACLMREECKEFSVQIHVVNQLTEFLSQLLSNLGYRYFDRMRRHHRYILPSTIYMPDMLQQPTTPRSNSYRSSPSCILKRLSSVARGTQNHGGQVAKSSIRKQCYGG